jgi:hypothetical protein
MALSVNGRSDLNKFPVPNKKKVVSKGRTKNNSCPNLGLAP